MFKNLLKFLPTKRNLSTRIINYKDTTPFIPPIKRGNVIKVYDGDTITIASKLPYKKSPLYRFSIRLARIDAPEIRAQNFKEKKLAIFSRDKLREKILHKNVKLKNIKKEKYGRVLADVYLGDICINDWLLSTGLAIPYNGGKKEEFKNMSNLKENMIF